MAFSMGGGYRCTGREERKERKRVTRSSSSIDAAIDALRRENPSVATNGYRYGGSNGKRRAEIGMAEQNDETSRGPAAETTVRAAGAAAAAGGGGGAVGEAEAEHDATQQPLLPFCPPSASTTRQGSSETAAAAAAAETAAESAVTAITEAADPENILRSGLHPTAISFLDALNLPAVHPLCSGANATIFGPDGVPPPLHYHPPPPAAAAAGGDSTDTTSIGSTALHAVSGTISATITLCSQVLPALLAMSELWLRLFAFVIAPLSALYLIGDEIVAAVWRHRRSSASGLRCGTGSSGGETGAGGGAAAIGSDGKEGGGCSGDTDGSNGTETMAKNDGGSVGNAITLGGCACCPNKAERVRRNLATSSTVVGMASSAVLLTDSLYVHEYGRSLGLGLYGILTVLSARTFLRRRLHWLVALSLLLIKVLVIVCLLRSEGGGTLDDHPGLDLPRVKEGLYYDHNNEFVTRIIEHWPETYRRYRTGGFFFGGGAGTGADGDENDDHDIRATPWLPTGDARTGIPFLINSSPPVAYRRVWAHNEEDGEHVALDIAFPTNEESGDVVHRSDMPLYMILHGLNGGSEEEYVREFVWRRISEGSTCVVMIARGLMDTPVVGWNVFHGARISDVHVASGLLRKALSTEHKQTLAGVGFSMGAIVLANYVARSGTDCHFDAAMAVSGGLDMREQINFYRSQRLWQPMLAKELRDTFIIGKFEARYRHRLSEKDFLDLMRSAHISEIDRHGVVTYNGFDDLMHYYTEMSAFGDHSICIDRSGSSTGSSASDGSIDTCPANILGEKDQIGRLSNISIPFVALHALDDPLVSYRTVAGVDPEIMVKSGSGNLILLLTKSGGHVGWPLGMNPSVRGWEWMNNAVRDFVLAVDAARKEQQ